MFKFEKFDKDVNGVIDIDEASGLPRRARRQACSQAIPANPSELLHDTEPAAFGSRCSQFAAGLLPGLATQQYNECDVDKSNALPAEKLDEMLADFGMTNNSKTLDLIKTGAWHASFLTIILTQPRERLVSTPANTLAPLSARV